MLISLRARHAIRCAFGALLYCGIVVALTPAQAQEEVAVGQQLAPYAAPVLPPPSTTVNGVSTTLHLDAETLGVIGGDGQRGAVSLAAFQANFGLDTAQAGWWRGGQFDLMLVGLRGSGNLQTRSGDLQLPSNLWAPNFLRVYQATYRQDFGPTFLQVGVQDMNNTFDVTDVAGHLHNASFGISPTLTGNANIATYPNPGLGAFGGVDLGGGASVQAGLWQADPPGMQGALRRGALAIAEFDQTWGSDAQGPSTTLKFGAWHQHNSPDGSSADGSGIYGIGQWTWTGSDQRQWGSFVQFGYSPAAPNVIRSYVGGGVRVEGLLPARPSDVLTVGVARAAPVGMLAETVVEAVYSLRLAHHLYLQPDLQHVRNPGGIPGRQWVAGLRLHLEQ
ncbi:MAG: carbohydrate porin [Pseudomonadota bacterium]